MKKNVVMIALLLLLGMIAVPNVASAERDVQKLSAVAFRLIDVQVPFPEGYVDEALCQVKIDMDAIIVDPSCDVAISDVPATATAVNVPATANVTGIDGSQCDWKYVWVPKYPKPAGCKEDPQPGHGKEPPWAHDPYKKKCYVVEEVITCPPSAASVSINDPDDIITVIDPPDNGTVSCEPKISSTEGAFKIVCPNPPKDANYVTVQMEEIVTIAKIGETIFLRGSGYNAGSEPRDIKYQFRVRPKMAGFPDEWQVVSNAIGLFQPVTSLTFDRPGKYKITFFISGIGKSRTRTIVAEP